MAFAIESSPNIINPAFNDNVYIVSSSDHAETNHRFVASVKNTSGDLLQRFEFVKPPGYDNGYINLGRYLSNFVKWDLDFDLDTFSLHANGTYIYNIEFGERYDGFEDLNMASLSNMVITNQGLDIYYFNDDYNPATFANRLVGNNSLKLFKDSKAWLYFWQNSTAVNRIKIEATTPGGVETTFLTNSLNSYFTSLGRFIYFPSGFNLNYIDVSLIAAAPSGGVIVPDDTTELKVQLANDTLGAITILDTHTYEIVGNCYKNYEVYYLNQFGAFDTLILPKGYHIKKMMDKTKSKRMAGGMDSSTSYNLANHAAQNVHRRVGYQTKWKLNTDWIEESESANLFNLVSSPVVYLNDEGTIKRVTITSSEHKQKSNRIDGLFNFTIELTESIEQERQWVS